ncbi:MAG: GNAT family N-acetyltransferase [Bdellovibrionales bacterium]|nr:GNAT family N-acetyltransferase [Bdellovibrionales bacterium]
MSKVLRKRVSVVVVHDGQILAFKAEDPKSQQKYVFLPGGVPEEEETLVQAAKRETLEETGYNVEIVESPSLFRKYDFEWDGVMHDCETHYFLGRLQGTNSKKVNDASYHQGVTWVPVEKMESVFSYHAGILNPLKEMVGQRVQTPNRVEYFMGRLLDPLEVIRLYEDSGISRPTNDPRRIARMYEHANLVVSAWFENELIGVARSLTDFSYCCYLSDLAVAKKFQHQGIGKKLIELTKEQIGPRSMLLLLSASNAMGYYLKVGFEKVENGYIIKRS